MDDLLTQMNRPHFYILKDGQPVGIYDARQWAAYMEEDPDENGRRCGHTEWAKFDKPTRLSTIFLGLDHNFAPNGLPLLWESCFFYGEFTPGQYSRVLNRYSSLEQAKTGHEELVAMIDLIEDLSGIIKPELGGRYDFRWSSAPRTVLGFHSSRLI